MALLPTSETYFLLSENGVTLHSVIWRMLLSRHFVLGHQRPICRCIVVQKTAAVSCPFLRMLPFLCIPEATEGVDVHFSFLQYALLNKFVVDETLGIARSSNSH
jgi:hypothetical protein